jgi:hypothetical protein
MACAEADMLERAKTPALRDGDLTVSGLLILGDAPRYHELGSELVAVGAERSSGSDARAKAVEALLDNAAFTDSPPSSWFHPGDDTEAFDALCRRGQANQSVSGDGRKVYAVVPLAIRPRALKRYDSSTLALVPAENELHRASKIEIAATLLLRGWAVCQCGQGSYRQGRGS